MEILITFLTVFLIWLLGCYIVGRLKAYFWIKKNLGKISRPVPDYFQRPRQVEKITDIELGPCDCSDKKMIEDFARRKK